MDFIIGCNYWASNAGTEMWKKWDENVVREDLKILSSHGVSHMRVFPNWRDFQPVIPIMTHAGRIAEYRLENDAAPENPYYIDEKMLKRFSEFCDICEEYDIKLIVGLLTGWMSGRLFIPPALYGKNLYTDSTALLFEQRFVTGFIKRLRSKKAICAWDLGNECNCMSNADDRFIAMNWTSVISNAIKAADGTRPVVSGMHSLSADDAGPSWSIQGQAEFTDILTTHPYPFWVEHTKKDGIASYRTSMHATCETKLYGDIGGKPCLVEEIGTMGPMLCSDEAAGDFLRCNLFSNYANGAAGVMWWCANEQTNLKTIPYTWNMCEVELGMIDANRNPKPVLKEMKKFADFILKLDFKLPKIKEEAVCILTKSQPQWGVGYMSYCLAKQNDISLRFAYCDQKIPESDVYMMPSICMHEVMPDETYEYIKSRVYDNGATLYISNNDGILSGFKELTGLKVNDSSLPDIKSGFITLYGEEISFTRSRKYNLTAENAQVIAYDDKGNPAMTKNRFGKGTVFYVNFPLEEMLIEESEAFDTNRYKIYSKIFENVLSKRKIISENKYISVTEHDDGKNTYCVAINYSAEKQNSEFRIKKGSIGKVYYGNPYSIEPFDAAVFLLEK